MKSRMHEVHKRQNDEFPMSTCVLDKVIDQTALTACMSPNLPPHRTQQQQQTFFDGFQLTQIPRNNALRFF